MRLGETQEDPAGEVRGMRTVGNYIREPGGWRRMRWDEHLHVNLDRDYRDIFSRPHPFAALFENKRVVLENVGPFGDHIGWLTLDVPVPKIP